MMKYQRIRIKRKRKGLCQIQRDVLVPVFHKNLTLTVRMAPVTIQMKALMVKMTMMKKDRSKYQTALLWMTSISWRKIARTILSTLDISQMRSWFLIKGKIYLSNFFRNMKTSLLKNKSLVNVMFVIQQWSTYIKSWNTKASPLKIVAITINLQSRLYEAQERQKWSSLDAMSNMSIHQLSQKMHRDWEPQDTPKDTCNHSLSLNI